MSGYLGNPDAESEHAIILSENGIQAARSKLPSGRFRFQFCFDCGDEIPTMRREAIVGCMFCVLCAPAYERIGKVKMLDRIL